jgi:ATP:ADP antiporter, AAA family
LLVRDYYKYDKQRHQTARLMHQDVTHIEGQGLLRHVVDVRPGETKAMFLSAAYFFFVLSSYYILRPIRDAMGSGELENVPYMFTVVLVTMVLLNPVYGAIVARYRRQQFIPYTYRFFSLNLVLFFLGLTFLPESAVPWIGRMFFVWVAVFNLFVVSVFWAFMADVFRSSQGKRLFGFIGAGGTIGAMTGSLLTSQLVEVVGVTGMLLASAAMIEVATQIVKALGHHATENPVIPAGSATAEATDCDVPVLDEAVGGSAWEGIRHALSNRFLLGIVAFMLLFTIGSTFLYFQRLALVADAFTDPAARVQFFARVDLIVNLLTLITQAYFTARLIKWLGVTWTLALLPAISIVGFLVLGAMPTLIVLVAFESVRRATNFAVARPTRELLFTVVSREDRFKAKNFIDTFTYRAGDQIGNGSWWLMATKLGLGVTTISFIAAPLMGLWLALALWLGWQFRAREMSRA